MDGAGLLNTEQAARLSSIASYSIHTSTYECNVREFRVSDSQEPSLWLASQLRVTCSSLASTRNVIT